jgi:hypothetical protein
VGHLTTGTFHRVVPRYVDGLDRHQAGALRRLLVAATASVGRPSPPEPLAPLVAAAPIEKLPTAAALHRVGGCVHEALVEVDGVPEAVLDALAAQRVDAARAHLVYCRALLEVNRTFGAADVPWVAMKGPVLASRVYHDPGLRTYGDLDLLIAQPAMPTAVGLLEDLGYEHVVLNWPLHQWHMASEFGMHRGPVNLDVHWHMVYSRWERRYFSIDPAAMLARSRTAVISGQQIPTFDDVDTLLHLCLHASRAGGHRLIWSKDIERTIAVLRPDLDELVDRARDYRCGPPVAIALSRAVRTLGADVPPRVIQVLAGRRLLLAERATSQVSPTVPFTERDSAARFLARSTRSRLRTTLLDLGERSVRAAQRLLPTPAHETGDPRERRHYLEAVAREQLRPPGQPG